MRLTKQVGKELALEAAFFAASAAEIALCHGNTLLLTALMIATGVLAMAFLPGRGGVGFYVTGAAVGTVGEALCVSAGAWQYAHPSVLGIPAWLPFAWGQVILLVKAIAETSAKIRPERSGDALRPSDPP